ncbi:MAG: dihydropteroate synthase, partial [Desulfitobacterium sp.]|nr:dihydropteroate synthase [Desulfitobacterium sp.]
AGLARCRKQGMINSISAEEKKWEVILPLIKKYKPKVVAQCVDNSGMPNTVEKRLAIAEELVEGLREAGVPDDDIFLDPLVKPISISSEYGLEVLECAEKLRSQYPHIHIVSGLSNISIGLPERRLLNRVFAVACAIKGMDTFLLDPLDQGMMSLLAATKALIGEDEYCMDYISGVRAGRIRSRDNLCMNMSRR